MWSVLIMGLVLLGPVALWLQRIDMAIALDGSDEDPE